MWLCYFRMDEMMRGQRGWCELSALGDKINKFSGMIEGLIWSPRGSDSNNQQDDWASEEVYICNLLPPLSLFWNRCTTYLLSHWDIHIHYICFRFLAPSKFCHLWIVKISELYVGERNLCKDPQIRRLCCQFLYTMTYCNNEIWNSIFWCSEVRVSWFFTFLLSYDIKLREYLTTYSLSGTSLWFCWADMWVYSMCSTNKK